MDSLCYRKYTDPENRQRVGRACSETIGMGRGGRERQRHYRWPMIWQGRLMSCGVNLR